MSVLNLYTALAVAIPVAASIIVFTREVGISERHHSHHDTYVIGSTLTLMLVFTMIIMGAIGLLLGWLCLVGVFRASYTVVLGFFDAFLVITFLLWLLLRRYKVVIYDDHLEYTPFFGHKVTVAYDEISAMEWSPSILMPSSRSIRVFVGNRRRVLLWSGLDLDQILVRINRFDTLDNLSSSR